MYSVLWQPHYTHKQIVFEKYRRMLKKVKLYAW
jgi:hypothetical protein